MKALHYKTRSLDLVEAVQLRDGVNLNAAIDGAPLLEQETPKWVDKLAASGHLTISKQVGTSTTHLFLDTHDGSFLVNPTDWIVNIEERFYCFSNEIFNLLFQEDSNDE